MRHRLWAVLALCLLLGGAALAQGVGVGVGVDDLRKATGGAAGGVILLTGGNDLLTGGNDLLKE